jgi:GTPase SAR1 family protein
MIFYFSGEETITPIPLYSYSFVSITLLSRSVIMSASMSSSAVPVVEFVLFGIGGAGKTSIVRLLSGSQFEPAYLPGMTLQVNEIIRDGVCFRVFDTAGQVVAERNDNLKLVVGNPKRVAVVVFSKTYAISYVRAREFVSDIRKTNPDTRIVMCCTHSDISRHESIPSKYTIKRELGVEVVEVSSLKNTGFDSLVEILKQ